MKIKIYLCVLLGGTFAVAMKEVQEIPVTLLNALPRISVVLKACGLEEYADDKKWSSSDLISSALAIQRALKSHQSEHLKNILYYSKCSQFTLKNEIQDSTYNHFLQPLSFLLRETFTHGELAGDQTNRNILFDYGFHIPVDEEDVQNVDYPKISEKIAEDPRLFGAFYWACERYKKNIKSMEGLLLLKKRNTPLVSVIPKDVMGLLKEDLLAPSDLVHDHCEMVMKFNQSPTPSYTIRRHEPVYDETEYGRVTGWPADMTRDQIEKEIGPKVLENYDRLLKEWKQIQIERSTK